MTGNFDIVVAGAGFSGAVFAERCASQLNQKVLVVEKRDHIAGNCYDCFSQSDILIHKYGPHIFHTDKKHVWDYLSGFTQWRDYEHKVLADVDGQLIPVPFNLNSLHATYPKDSAALIEAKLLEGYGSEAKIPILELLKSADPDLRQLARFVYEKIFINYTSKQWGVPPESIAPEVTARVPVFVSRDDRYFQDAYQAIPQEGYSKLIGNLLSHRNIQVRLNTDIKELITIDPEKDELELSGQARKPVVIYSGMLDDLFDYCLGELQYRSLQFEYHTLQQESFQPVATVNYPNSEDFTRITEFKKLTGQQSDETTIVKEFPQDYDRTDPEKNIPYYPMMNDESRGLYERYLEKSRQFSNLIVTGRLGDYRYYNMDDAVDRSLSLFERYSKSLHGAL